MAKDNSELTAKDFFVWFVIFMLVGVPVALGLFILTFILPLYYLVG